WRIGFPDDAATKSVHVEGEGVGQFARNGALVVGDSFDVTIALLPAWEVQASRETITAAAASRLAAALHLAPVASATPAPHPPLACALVAGADRIELTLVDSKERERVWRDHSR